MLMVGGSSPSTPPVTPTGRAKEDRPRLRLRLQHELMESRLLPLTPPSPPRQQQQRPMLTRCSPSVYTEANPKFSGKHRRPLQNGRIMWVHLQVRECEQSEMTPLFSFIYGRRIVTSTRL